MNVNLKYFKINTSGEKNQFVRFSLINSYMVKECQRKNKENELDQSPFKSTYKHEPYPTWYVITLDELPMAIECLKGKSKFYPFFDDGIHKIQFKPDGIHSLEVNTPHCEEYYFTFPGEWIVECLEWILAHPGIEYSIDLTNEIYSQLCQFAPRLKWEMENDVKLSLKNNLNLPRFKSSLINLVRIAKNYSNGKANIIHLSFDSYQDRPDNKDICNNYYWWIEYQNTGQRIMNGGLIFHPKYIDGQPDYSSGEYSIHT